MTPSTKLRWLRPLLWVVAVLVVILMAGSLITTFRIRQQTGILRVSLTDPKSQAVLTISRDGYGAAVIGVGQAKVRLEPGTYHLMASEKGRQTTAFARVELRQTTTTKLDLTKSALLPSALSIDFENTDEFINNGLTQTQVSAIKKAFFSFKRDAHSVVIASRSVQPAARNPDITNDFTDNFSVRIDGKAYNGTVTYSDLSTVRLVLRDAVSGAVVFSQ